ncbi:CPBP family intramembrane glutamic endopeptidase [Cellulomonas sp. S1-8]|uniref:CPBP family intramembrane glutamic endopeptidase n=1 Tax=Cellulomonas sp. S1-8 TaxID=2904790 RepID=UPI0022439B4F|nr:type II CAAX endopeptidase family protein [Cellulomonas sp. S1-8]UZN03720.1 CPBP family intramembrane metalloprotease [Cellulomonas sp. S1-8]
MSVVTAQAPAPPRRGGALDIVRRRPLLSFFVLALLASWIAWIPYILSNHGLGIWDFSFPGGTGGGQLLGMLPGAYLGPIGAALFVTAIADGRAGLRAWARRLWNWKVSWKWYVGILLSVPAALILSGLVFSGGQAHMPSAMILGALVPGLLVQMVTTGLAEEPGWRDFALPRMQRIIGAPGAAVAIGALWGVWHLPLFVTEWADWSGTAWYRGPEFVAFCIAFNVVMTWVFNRTGQSLPMAMLLHCSVNNFSGVWGEIFPMWDGPMFLHLLLVTATVAGAVTLLGSRGRLGYHPDPADHLEHQLPAARLS